jgi:hypothetical protein
MFLGSSGLFLYSSWKEFLNDSKKGILLSAETTLDVIQESLEDSQLLLNFIKQKFGENYSLDQGLDPNAHELL